MKYTVDIIFLVVFALVIFVSKKKGFFSSLFDLVAYFASLVGAKLLSTTLAPQVYETSFAPIIREKIVSSLGDVATVDYSSQIESAIKELPESVSGIMTLLGIDTQAVMDKVADANVSGQRFIDYLMSDIVSPIATAIVRTVLFVIIAFLLSVILKIVIRLFKGAIERLPKLKQIDSGLGVVLGILKGAVLVFIIALILGVVVGFTGNEQIVESVNNSIVVNVVKGFLDSVSGYIIK